MKDLTFEDLPKAIELILGKIEAIEEDLKFIKELHPLNESIQKKSKEFSKLLLTFSNIIIPILIDQNQKDES